MGEIVDAGGWESAGAVRLEIMQKGRRGPICDGHV